MARNPQSPRGGPMSRPSVGDEYHEPEDFKPENFVKVHGTFTSKVALQCAQSAGGKARGVRASHEHKGFRVQHRGPRGKASDCYG